MRAPYTWTARPSIHRRREPGRQPHEMPARAAHLSVGWRAGSTGLGYRSAERQQECRTAAAARPLGAAAMAYGGGRARARLEHEPACRRVAQAQRLRRYAVEDSLAHDGRGGDRRVSERGRGGRRTPRHASGQTASAYAVQRGRAARGDLGRAHGSWLGEDDGPQIGQRSRAGQTEQ